MAKPRKRGKTWYYTFIDATGKRVERSGCTDYRETVRMMVAADIEARKVQAGLIDPRELVRKEHAARPLMEHIRAWGADLLARGNSPKHVELYVSRACRVAALACGARLEAIDPPTTATQSDREQFTKSQNKTLESGWLADLTPEKVQSALDTLRKSGRSLATCNHHRGAVRSLSRWLYATGRTQEDVLRGVRGFNASTDRRHDRRTLDLDDLRRLIAVAYEGQDYRGMTGPARALVYRLAASTGLRYSELASLTAASFNLSNDRPTVTIQAAYAKNGQTSTLPVPSDLRADLVAFLDGLPSGAPVFNLPTGDGARMLRLDLDRAGIAYRDDSGQVFDFHSLRCQMATALDQAGASPRTTQRLMRHSSLALTDRYTRPRAHDIEAATDRLPSLKPEPPETLAATGTDSRAGLATHLPHSGDAMSRRLSDAVETAPLGNDSPSSCNPLEMKGFDVPSRPLSGPVVNSGVRDRTGDLRVMNPPHDQRIPFKGKTLQKQKPGLATHLPHFQAPADLAEVIQAWPTLPPALQAAVLAIIRSRG